MKASITIEHRALLALALLTSKDQTRYILNGVCLMVYPDHARLVGCDGRRLGVIRIEPSKEELDTWPAVFGTPQRGPITLIIPRDMIADSKPTAGSTVLLEAEKISPPVSKFLRTRITLPRGKRTISGEAIDGNYPNVLQILDDVTPTPTGHICFNPRLLEGFVKAASLLRAKAIGHEGSIAVYLYGDETKPIGIRVPGRSDFIGVLMPVRSDGGHVDGTMPTWARRLGFPAAPAGRSLPLLVTTWAMRRGSDSLVTITARWVSA